jgi:hypothetical protein
MVRRPGRGSVPAQVEHERQTNNPMVYRLLPGTFARTPAPYVPAHVQRLAEQLQGAFCRGWKSGGFC